MISDHDESLGSRYFLNVPNERACFSTCARIKSQGVNFLLGMQKDDETGNKEWNS